MNSFGDAGNDSGMSIRLSRAGRVAAVVMGVATLAAVAVLLARDAFPRFFPAWAHDSLATFSLAAIAVAYLAYQLTHRPAPIQLAKAIIVAAAFLFWAANQFWSSLPQAALFNDIAIGLFVFDLFLVIAEWPQSPSSSESFAESDAEGWQEERP
jgi:hypothetical protein